ncbi:hypothetical protein F5Y07DRAFT_405810 [Xylaria sp. FL0933]|nr:hypothetical protein F5Y07DRAFT_405810 [Xylaria sp. FL0933]
MFPIDTTLLPSLTTRKALLVVDAQNDFLADDGALPITIPIDLPEKIRDFAIAFRENGGEIIWVQSQFERSRPSEDEQIMISNTPSPSGGAAPARGRRSRNTPPVAEPTFSPDAFLTPDAGQGPTCVKAGTPGVEMHPIVKQAVGPKDFVLTKSFYSAFKVDELLRVLRVRFVTELFICGCLTNVGIMATAIDAASYGYTITIVSDCCGVQSMSRHRAALGQIASTTGCDTVPAATVLSMMKPKPNPASERADSDRPHRHRDAAGGRPPNVRLRRGRRDATAPSASDIQPSFERLSLSGESAAVVHEHAPTIIAASEQPRQQQRQQRQSEPKPQSQSQRSRSQSQSQSQSALQPMARPGHSQTQNQADRDIITATPNTRPPAASNNHNSNAYPSASADNRYEKPDGGRYESVRSNEENEEDEKEEDEKEEDEKEVWAQSPPLFEGDTMVVYNILPEAISDDAFARIRSEVAWQRMWHQGGEVPRLVAVQGLVEADGSKPVYRHPADESPPLRPFTPAVDTIRGIVEKELGHPLNHVLIQLYRAGPDYISEHCDKTLDIVRGSFIANVSLGAERTMVLRLKQKLRNGESKPQQVRLPHNSLFKMGLATNARWLHGIKQDKRSPRDKAPAELAYDGARISLTFRHIGTFLTGDEVRIWGQGATAKKRENARAVVSGLSDSASAVAMLRAFGNENKGTELDWEKNYGAGFDVLHLTLAKRLFESSDAVVNLRLKSLMAELGVSHSRGSISGGGGGGGGGDDRGAATEVAVKFVDNDEARTSIVGQREIMLYVEETYGGKATLNEEDVVSKRFEQGMGLLDAWRREGAVKISSLLAPWDEYATEAAFIAGPEPSLADFAFWPVLYDIFSSSSSFSSLDNETGKKRGEEEKEKQGEQEEGEEKGKGAGSPFPHLRAYHDRMRNREAIAQLLPGR